jgi:Na+-translocating ferredoxin:NAD+ oxidoreductase RNF subunit RnfB
MEIAAILGLGGIGLLFGVGLCVASKVFRVEIDPKIEKILEILPGANCGACGFAGCKGYAEAVVRNPEVKADLCIAGGEEIANMVGKIIGKEVSKKERKYAIVKCRAKRGEVKTTFLYDGIFDCKAALLLFGGDKGCGYGCLGYGSCVGVCPFGAINIKEGVAWIDSKRCRGCGLCVDVCPKEAITLVPESAKVLIFCNSKDKGAFVKKTCKCGCIGCRLCVKVCEEKAMAVENNLANLIWEKCNGCGKCTEKCPTNTIIKV